MPSAHVNSLPDLLRFRQSLVQFQEEGLGILTGLDQQSQRLLQWLEGDAPTHWRQEVLRCQELISRARSALETAMMKKSRDYTPSCIEQKEELQASKQRLVRAEERRESVRRWARLAREEIDEYRGRVAPLREWLEQEIPRAIARIDTTVQALERYLATGAPTAPRLQPLSAETAPASFPGTGLSQPQPRFATDDRSEVAEVPLAGSDQPAIGTIPPGTILPGPLPLADATATGPVTGGAGEGTGTTPLPPRPDPDTGRPHATP